MPAFSKLPLPFLAACSALALMPGLSGARADGGFAVELSPPVDFYAPVRVGVRAYGTAVDPAATYVRGCQGHLVAESAAAAFEVTAPFETLAFTAAGEGLVSMVLGTPDGLYRCANVGPEGLASTGLSAVVPGRYLVWLGGAEGAMIDARLIASDRPISALELNGLDVAALGEPRSGRHVFAATLESGRQELVMGAAVVAEHEMRPLSPDYCPGYSRFDAADAVLTLDAAQPRISVFATSERDLTIAVVAPDGTVLCNDDAYQLNPGVTVEGAAAGDYQIFVGGYSQGPGGVYDLFASVGGPAFTDVNVNLAGAPRVGYAALDAMAAASGQVLGTGTIVSRDPLDGLPSGGYCAGFSGVDAPDMVLTLDQAQPLLSFYASSQTDLVLAVHGPDGRWMCNDDDFGLNPAVRFDGAPAGDYHVFVGAYGQGAQGSFHLYAALGQPNWAQAESAGSGPGGAMPDPFAEPAVGRISFGPQTRIDPRLIFDIAPSDNEIYALGESCAGFIDVSRPDVVITVEEGLPQLMVYMVSEADGTLLVMGPDGQVHCNDDYDQLNPGVVIVMPQPGDYAVFSGTYGGGGGIATMGATIANPVWVMDREH